MVLALVLVVVEVVALLGGLSVSIVLSKFAVTVMVVSIGVGLLAMVKVLVMVSWWRRH